MSITPETPGREPPTIMQTLQRAAEREYDKWIRSEAGEAFTGSVGARQGFIDGYLLACKEWGPF